MFDFEQMCGFLFFYDVMACPAVAYGVGLRWTGFPRLQPIELHSRSAGDLSLLAAQWARPGPGVAINR